MPHPDEGLIHAWLDRELDAAEAARVEALVASDPEWAVAAMEARGLLARSTLIVGELDRVPANVMPRASSPRRSRRRWIWRVAAVVALMAGSAVVLEREAPELTARGSFKPPVEERSASPVASSAAPAGAPAIAPAAAQLAAPVSMPAVVQAATGTPAIAKKSRPAVTPTAAESAVAAIQRPKAEPGLAANAPVAINGSTINSKEIDIAKRSDAAPARAQALLKTTRLLSTCFLRRDPADSAWHMIRLDALALADSMRLQRLTVRGDTLATVDRSLIAIRVPCPEP